MELYYINSDKGKVLTLIGALFILIFIIIITIFYIASTYFEPIRIFLESTRFVLFKRQLDLIGFMIFIIIFYFYEVIDFFIDGVIMVLIKITVVLVLFFIILQEGVFAVFFQFIFLEINFTVNFTLVLLIILFVYFWILTWEIIIIFIKRHPEKKMPSSEKKIKKLVKKKWIDFDKETIIAESGERLFDDWTDVELYERQSIKYYLLSTVVIIGTGFIFGLIFYFMFDVPAEGNYYNNFILASFFPFWSITFTAFLSIRHYIRAIIYCSFMIFLEFYLLSSGLITVEGVFFIQYVIIISQYLSMDLSSFFNSLSTSQFLDLILKFVGIFFIFEFILLVISIFISLINQRSRKIQILASSKNFYFRHEETYNSWKMLFDLFSIILWPFNPYVWEALIKKIRYKKEGKKESLIYNYGRLSYDKSIKTLRKYKANWVIFILKIIVYIIIGIFTLKYYIGYLLFAATIVETLRFVRAVKKIRVKIRYLQKYAEGSVFMKGKFDILIIYGVPKDIATNVSMKTIR